MHCIRYIIYCVRSLFGWKRSKSKRKRKWTKRKFLFFHFISKSIRVCAELFICCNHLQMKYHLLSKRHILILPESKMRVTTYYTLECKTATDAHKFGITFWVTYHIIMGPYNCKWNECRKNVPRKIVCLAVKSRVKTERFQTIHFESEFPTVEFLLASTYLLT